MWHRTAILILVTALLPLPACTKTRPAPEKKVEPVTRVILISIDTLRADYLGCYNPEKKTSPNVDRFAKDSLLCTDVFTQAPSTAISHKSILYSLYPFVHKTSIVSVPSEKMKSPIEALRENGFHTAAFVAGGQLKPVFGFARGFDVYTETPFPKLFKTFSEWLARNQSRNFFLFLHTYVVHCPYVPPAPYRKKFAAWYKGDIDPVKKCGPYYDNRKMTADDVQFVRDLYSAEVYWMDNFFGRFLAELRKAGIYDKTMIVFVSDHGESLGERKVFGHNEFVMEQLKIPLILKIPGVQSGKVDAPLEAIDIMPTIFDALGVRQPYPFQGKSILAHVRTLKTIDTSRIRMAEQYSHVSIRNGNYISVIPQYQKPPELYDLVADPMQFKNIAPANPQIVAEHQRYYDLIKAKYVNLSAQFEVTESSRPILDPEAKEQLKALGYIQ